MTPILLGLTTVLAMLYLYHARQNKILKTDALLPRGQWSTHRVTFLNFGFVFALGFVTMAFEYESVRPNYDQTIEMTISSELDMEVIRTAFPDEPDLPPPPPEDKEVPKFNALAPLELVADAETLPELDLIEETPIPVPKNVKVVLATPPPPKPADKPVLVIDEVDEIVPIAEVMPMFPGCESTGGSDAELQACATKKMLEFIYAHVEYPEIAKNANVEGTAVVTFVVEKDGSISKAEILRNPGAYTGQAALAVVEQFPKWIPGKQRGRPVRVQFNLPIKFKLER